MNVGVILEDFQGTGCRSGGVGAAVGLAGGGSEFGGNVRRLSREGL